MPELKTLFFRVVLPHNLGCPTVIYKYITFLRHIVFIGYNDISTKHHFSEVFQMFDWHKAYEASELKDIVTLFLDSGLRREAGVKIVDMLIAKPNSRRGAIIENMEQEGYAKATIERTLRDLETIGLITSEGKYLKTGRYRVNLARFSSSLSRLSRTVKKVEQNIGPQQDRLKDIYD